MTQLARLQEWVPSDCEAVLGPRMSALVDWVDSKVVELAIKARAHELRVPSLIERSTLERAGYFESFPGSTVEQSEGGCMPPAVCYHCYAKLAAASLPRALCLDVCRALPAQRGQQGAGPLAGIYDEGDCVRRVCRLGTGTAAGMDGSHIGVRAIASASRATRRGD